MAALTRDDVEAATVDYQCHPLLPTMTSKTHLDNTQGGRGDGIREVSSRRRDCPHNGDATLPLGGPQAGDPAGPLIKGG